MQPTNWKLKIENRQSKGSALLMVVGLLVILAMLGMTFVVISHVDRRQAEALAAKAPVDPIAMGIVKQISALLKDDLYIDDGADGLPGTLDDLLYRALPSTPSGWRGFIDYPSDGTNADPWLASMEKNAAGTLWVRISDLTGDANYNYEGVPTSGNPNYTDTDGDGDDDALLYDTGVRNVDGDEYWAAVRIVDLGGLLNVNTAGEPYDPLVPTTLIRPTSPANIDLLNGLFAGNATNYDSFHNVRCGGTGAALQDFSDESASSLLSPDTSATPYLPFGIGDEMHLRYTRSSAITERTGRLYDATKDASSNPLADTTRQMLTTFNCSRISARLPIAGDTRRWLLDGTTDDLSDATDGPPLRQLLYEKLLSLFADPATATASEKRRAAHFVANLWAHQDASGNVQTTDHWKFTPTDPTTNTPETFSVYGLSEDPVISEAFSNFLSWPDATAPGAPAAAPFYRWFTAIEIYNPYSNQIDLSKFGFEIAESPGWRFPLAIATAPDRFLASGERRVYYRHIANYNSNLSEAETHSSLPAGVLVSGNPNWVLVDTGNAMADNDFRFVMDSNPPGSPTRDPIQLVWVLDPTNPLSPSVVVDQVSRADVGAPSVSGNPTGQSPASNCIQRDDDDDPNHARFAIAAYKSTSAASNNIVAGHTLGAVNNADLQAGTADVGSCIYPIPLSVPHTLSDEDWFIGKVYFSGHYKDGGTERAFSKAIGQDFPTDTPARGRFDLMGTVPTPTNPGTDPAGWPKDIGDYPDVPAACMAGELFEMLSPDTTRLDAAGNPMRIYGRLNINTATHAQLELLPWPAYIDLNGNGVEDAPAETLDTVLIDIMIDYILAYRDLENVATASVPTNYLGGRSAARNFDQLRDATNYKGFLTPGEIAIPLADFVNTEMLASPLTDYTPPLPAFDDHYLEARDSLYKSISNLISVNSDVFAANIVVQLRDAGAPLTDPPAETWRYLSVFDRGNCRTSTDSPAVLLFTELE